LATIGIFVYPKIADKTEIDNKLVSFLAQKTAPTVEGGEVGTEESDETSTQEDINLSENEISSEVILPEKEVEVEYKDSYLVQTLSDEEKKELKTAYNTVLHKMGLPSDNLRFYEMKTYDGQDYYAFQVVDDVLDVTADPAQLGKSIGKDQNADKTTFLTYYTVDEASAYARALTDEACDAVADYDASGTLRALARYLAERVY
jgi:hypothetical protein